MTKKRKIVLGASAALLALAGWKFFGGSQAVQYRYRVAAVSTGSVSDTVKQSGRVTFDKQVKLTFKQSSVEVSKIYVKSGETVKKDQLLAELDKSDWRSTYSQQVNSLKSADVSYRKLTASPKEVELVKARTAVSDAENSVHNAETALKLAEDSSSRDAASSATQYSSLADTALTSAKAASRELRDAIEDGKDFLSTETNKPWRDVLGAKDSSTVQPARDAFAALRSAADALDSAVSAASASGWPSSRDDVSKLAAATRDAASSLAAYAARAVKLAYATVATAGLSESDVASFLSSSQSYASKADSRVSSSNDLVAKVAAAADSSYAGLSASGTVEQKRAALESARNNLAQAKASLADLLAGATAEEREQSLLTIQQAKTKLSDVKRQASDYELRAPFAGVVASVDLEEGQIQNQNTTSTSTDGITVWDPSSARVRLLVDQSEVSRVRVGQKSVVKLDAYSNQSFSGTVNSIDPVPVETSGVVSYYVYVKFDLIPDGVLDGMTATIQIATNSRDDVTMVSTDAVFSSGGKSYVSVIKGDLPSVPSFGSGSARSRSGSLASASGSAQPSPADSGTGSRRSGSGSFSGARQGGMPGFDYSSLETELREVSVTTASAGMSEVISGLVPGEKVLVKTAVSGSSKSSSVFSLFGMGGPGSNRSGNRSGSNSGGPGGGMPPSGGPGPQ